MLDSISPPLDASTADKTSPEVASGASQDLSQVGLEMPISSQIGQGRGVFFSTYGCQMNVNDSERMMSLLEMMNFTAVSEPEDADLIIINSCSVREKPVHKVHSEVGRYKQQKLIRKTKIGVTGCVAQQEKQQLMKDIPALDFVLGTDAIDQLPQLVARLFEGEERLVSARFEHGKPYQVQTLIRNPGVATFVNITKGCDNFCTFCVVPYTRGRERSRAMKEVLQDVKDLVKRGVKEITLLGQNVNSYESVDCKTSFAGLLKTIAEETDISRIRYTTSHPKDFDRELCEISERYRSKICDYIHLPVQSGNSDVLQRMNRGYTRAQYLEKVAMIKETIPGIGLSTDIIVGFPGETEEQYEDTVSLLHEVQYDSIYAFMYSPRPFTKAARWPDQITLQEKSRRLNRLFEVQKEISGNLAQRFMGQVKEVLVEGFNAERGSRLTGRTTENKLCYFNGPAEMVGQMVNIRVTACMPSVLHGELLAET